MAKAPKVNKSAYVRSLPPTMVAADVVKAAAEKGMKLSEKFVHTIRYNAKVAAKKKSGPGAMATGKRRPGRPRKAAGADSGGHEVGNGLESAIEHLVEAKVNAILASKFGALLGR